MKAGKRESSRWQFGAPRCAARGREAGLGTGGGAKRRKAGRHSPEAWFYCAVLFVLTDTMSCGALYSHRTGYSCRDGGGELGVGKSHLSRHVLPTGLTPWAASDPLQSPRSPRSQTCVWGRGLLEGSAASRQGKKSLPNTWAKLSSALGLRLAWLTASRSEIWKLVGPWDRLGGGWSSATLSTAG